MGVNLFQYKTFWSFGALLRSPFPTYEFQFSKENLRFFRKKDYFCSIHIIIVSEDKNRQTMWNCQAELTI